MSESKSSCGFVRTFAVGSDRLDLRRTRHDCRVDMKGDSCVASSLLHLFRQRIDRRPQLVEFLDE